MIAGQSILINGAFRGQTITGQQRYAHEIAEALLLERDCPVREVSPAEGIRGSKWLVWAWVQSFGFHARKGEVVISLSSRAPVFASNHAVVIHDLFVLQHPEWFSRFYRWTHAPLLRWQLKSARLLIAVSEPVAEQIRARVGEQRSIVVASNAPADVFLREESRDDDLRILDGLGLGSGSYFLTVGSNDPRKNLDVLVAAFADLSDASKRGCPLIVVGGTTANVFRKTATTIPEGVIMFGRASDTELAVMYRHARAVVFPSLDEGFGLPAVEALATGAVLLASDIPVLRWVCGAHAIYVPARDLQGWTDALEATENVARPSTTGSARSYVRSRFDWAQSAELIAQAVTA